MRKLSVFNQVSVDGYFRTTDGDIDWVKQRQGDDPEFKAFIGGNASGGGVLLFGRKTYEMMASFWPTPAAEQFPEVAKGMKTAEKVVFSKTLKKPTWNNTTVVNGDLVAEVRKLK